MPTPAMRQAMATTPLGDDVFGDDPAVNRLEQVAAARLGKEAAVFLPSGTMGNVMGVAVNARTGEEMIADAEAHVFLYEGAGAAVISGVQIRPVATEAGVMSPAQIEAAIRPRNDVHQPITAAVTLRTHTTATAASSGRWKIFALPLTPPVPWGCACTSTAPGCSTPRSQAGRTSQTSPHAGTL
jgi:threonine aldolase